MTVTMMKSGKSYLSAPEWYKDEDLEPPATCPLIDGVISGIDQSLKVISRADRLNDADDLKAAMGDIEGYLNGLEDELNMIRAMNERLRDLASRRNP